MAKAFKPRKQIGMNTTIIRDGHIVKIRKDGTIKSIGDKYTPNHPKK